MNLKISKFKGGKIGFRSQLYGLNKKMGGAAVKKLTDEEIKSMESLSIGGSINKIKTRSIRPLNFKL
jgi:hypothetical protein